LAIVQVCVAATIGQWFPSSSERLRESLISLISNVHHSSVFAWNEMLKYDLIQHWKMIGHLRDSIEERYLNELFNLEKETDFQSTKGFLVIDAISTPLLELISSALCPNYDLVKSVRETTEIHDASHH